MEHVLCCLQWHDTHTPGSSADDDNVVTCRTCKVAWRLTGLLWNACLHCRDICIAVCRLVGRLQAASCKVYK